MINLQKKIEILLVEDDEKDIFFIEKSLNESRIRFNLEKGNTLKKALSVLKTKTFDIILLDLTLPDSKGIDTVNDIITKSSNIPVVVLTGTDDTKTILDAASKGVEDYLLKNNIRPDILSKTIYYSIERKKNELELLNYKSRLEEIVSERTEDLKKANTHLVKNLDYTEKLVEFGKKINNSLKMDNIIKTVKEMIKEVLYADNCSVFLFDNEKDSLTLLLHNYSKWEKKDDKNYNNKNGIMRDCIENKKPIMITEFSKSKYAVPEKRKKYKNDAAICIPLFAEKQILGVMNLSNIDAGFLTEENFAKINTIAQHLSLAMKNSLLHEKVKMQSIVDELTQLYNRRYLYTVLENEINREKRFNQGLSILMLDIDYFKKINDENGHASGDKVLKKLSDTIKKNIRKIDTAGRYGGEEFVIILPFTNEAGAKIVAERIRKNIEDDVFISQKGNEIKITVSIGISRYHKNESADSFIDRSDTAMYDAKKKGRNQLVFVD